MKRVLSVSNMRRSDANAIALGTPGRELMFLAGKSIYENVAWKPPVAIVCGSGNNAGDGYAVAQLLCDGGIDCTVFMLSDRTSADGGFFLQGCRERGIDIRRIEDGELDFSGFGTILDCIFGTGFKGEATGRAKEVIEAINASGAYIVCADINSGLDGDSGISKLCVHSGLTVSIGDYKPGHFLNMAKDVMKKRMNYDIGIEPVEEPFWLLEHDDFKDIFKPRRNYSNKGSFGYISLIGGSKRYCGAIKLASMANAAMRSGAGVVKIAVPASLAGAVAPFVLESTLFPLSDNEGEVVFNEREIDELSRNTRTIAFGMGVGVTDETAMILRHLLKEYSGTLIIDADGLTVLSKLMEEDTSTLANAKPRVVLTPHAKEFARLNGTSIEGYMDDPIEAARSYAHRTGAIVLLKGPTTIVTDGSKVYLTSTGCPGMATAGSGDVLSGILAAVCSWAPAALAEPDSAQSSRTDTKPDTKPGSKTPSKTGEDDALLLSVAAGAYINGRAGELAQLRSNPISMTAGDTAQSIKDAIGEYFR